MRDALGIELRERQWRVLSRESSTAARSRRDGSAKVGFDCPERFGCSQ